MTTANDVTRSHAMAADAIAHACQGRFHRSVVCPRTGHRVSFALIGHWDRGDVYGVDVDVDAVKGALPRCSHLTLFLPPSGCSRYMGMLLDGVALAAGVAMLAVDRPGTGSVPMVAAQDRMRTSTDHVVSVLEALRVERVSAILTHSAGWFYALELVRSVPNLFSGDDKCRIVFSSPFVPTHLSSSALSLLPAGVVRMAPAASSLLGSCGKAISWSAGVRDQIGLGGGGSGKQPSASAGKAAAQNAASRARHPDAKFHPPYTPALPQPHTDVILKYFNKENGVEAAVQDFLFCLGKTPNLSNQELETWTEERLDGLVDASVLVVWAGSDFMTPQRGRTYLQTAMQERGVELEEWVMAEAGHDETTASREVMRAVFAQLRGG